MGYNYAIGSLAVINGTVSITNGSPNVVGIGTAFLMDFAVGDPVRINGVWRTVLSITNNALMIVTSNWLETLSGVSAYKVTPTFVDTGQYTTQGTPAAVAGTVSITNGSPTVTGIGTSFTTDFAVNSPVRINGVWRTVASIATDLSMATTSNWLENLSGATAYKAVSSLVTNGLTIPAPKSVYGFYSKPLPLGTGGIRAGGWKTTEWRWGFISQAQRTSLRTYITSASAELYIRTRIYDSSDVYAWFIAQAVWPLEEDRQTTRRLSFVIKMQAMQQISFPA